MRCLYNTLGRQLMLKFTIKTKCPVVVCLIVKDANKNKPNTYYTNRYNTIDGISNFYVRLPQSPKVSEIQIYNQKTGGDDGFEFLITDKKPFVIEDLVTKMDTFDFKNPDIANIQ